MDRLDFWKDKTKKTIDPNLYAAKAEQLAKKLADECIQSRKKLNKRTQIRKFYDEITRLNMASKASAGDWENIMPLVYMIPAKAAYAKGRELVSESFLAFIRNSVQQVEEPDDLAVFANLFESFYGFYRMYCPAN